ERIGDTTFLILRVFDPNSPETGGTIQDITRKIAIYFRAGLIITVHRVDLPAVRLARERFVDWSGTGTLHETRILGYLINSALDSFEAPLDVAERTIGVCEDTLLTQNSPAPDLQTVHGIKRRIGVIKRLLWQTNSVIQRLVPVQERAGAVFQDVKENAESYYFYAEQLLDEINNLQSLHVAMASQRAGDVMRVLTVFSAFFLPLTFIVGIYGMNFEWMPELRHRWGYPGVLVLMGAVCVGIAVWFRRRGWLG
ncbi:MAG: CorA family divalent cation transporter, partial [Gemmatimonadales bacterium]